MRRTAFVNRDTLKSSWSSSRTGRGVLDSLDVKILRMLMMGGGSFLGNEVRRPYGTIAARIGITEDTVRNRIEKFRKEGFIKGWKLGMNPSLFGRQASFLLLDVRPPPSKEDVIRKIGLVEGVLFILSYFGNFLGVQITGESEQALRKKGELIAKISNSENLVSMKITFPKCEVRLTQTDWSLIQALRPNPRRSFGAVAKELGISARTVRRRTERMTKGGVLYTIPDIDTKAIRGVMMFSFSVYYSGTVPAQKVAGRILSQLDEHLVLFHIADNEHGWFGMALPNPTRANEIERWTRGLDGVEDTSMRLVDGFVNLVDEAFGEELRKRIEARILAVQR